MKNKTILMIIGLFSMLLLSNTAHAQTLNLDSLMGSPIVSPRYPEAGDDFNLLCGYYDEDLETIDSITFKLISDDQLRYDVQINDTQRNVYYSPNGSYTVRDDELLDLSCTYQDGVKTLTVNKTVQVDTVVDDPRWFFTNVDTTFPTLSYYTNKFLDSTYSAMFDVDHDGFADIDNYDLTQEDIVGAKIQYDVPKQDLPYNLYLVVMPRGTKEQRPEGIELAKDDSRWQCPNDRGYFKTKGECTRIYNFTNTFDYYRIKTEDKDILEGIPLNKTKEYDIYIFSNAYIKGDNQTIYVQPKGSKDFIGTFQPNDDHLIIPVKASDYVLKTPWISLVSLGFLLGLGLLLISANFKLGIIFELITLIILMIRVFML